jgi:hypothetical protein
MKAKIEATDENCAKSKKDAIEAIEKAEHFFLVAMTTSDKDANMWQGKVISHGNVLLLVERVEDVMQNDDDYRNASLLLKMRNVLDRK